MAERRGLLSGYRINIIQEFAVEALVYLDRERELQRNHDTIQEHADDFWNEFRAKVASRNSNPYVALATLMPELGIVLDEPTRYPNEDKLPAPDSPAEREEIESWMRNNASGSVTGAQLNGSRP